MPDFNAAQRAAIAARNEKVLVSAAAGSGKTTVMVEKIKETLVSVPEASIDQFLVITFTRDAARNMKDKLRQLLEKEAEKGVAAAARALGEMETATISTIHAFCQQLLKEYNDNAGASMNPRVLKDTEKKRMLDESCTDAADALLGRESPLSREDRQAVSALLAAFTPEEIREMTQRVYDALMGIPEPFAFLDRVTRTLPVDLWNREIVNAIGLDVLGVEEYLRQEEALLEEPSALPAWAPTVESDRQVIATFLEAWDRVEEAEEKRALLRATGEAFVKAPAGRGLDEAGKAWLERFKKAREKLKGSKSIFTNAVKKLDALQDEKNDRLNRIIQQELRGLALLVRETAARYEGQKLEAGAIDYSDMEQIAYRVMKDPDRQKELLARYRYVYVDECQDVSGIQDAIIKALAGPGHQFFQVGDIKQSIYGFRHAEPELFDRERRQFSDAEEAPERRIFFMDNYRSSRGVVDAVNEVFAEAMDRRITDMDYLPEDHLRCNTGPDTEPVDVMLVYQGEEETDRLEAQCEAAGRYIQRLVTPAAETGGPASFQYRDIVILLRSARGTASALVEHLKKMQIPALYEGAPDFFGLAEVRAFVCLLSVLDNQRDDDALVGTLMGAPFLFTERDLAEIRLEKRDHDPFYLAFEHCAERNETPVQQKCRTAAEQLAAWRRTGENMPVPDFVWWLMRETGIYAARGAYPDGRARQANLDLIYQRALEGQGAGQMRLSDFVNELREGQESRLRDSDDHPALGAGDNCVRVMTMHKSKGLEFPAVLLMDLQKNFRRKKSSETLRMHISSAEGALGLYLPAVRPQRNSLMHSQGQEAFTLRSQRKSIAEETRLLYVAMTRAMKKLCLIGNVKEGDEALWRNATRPCRVWQTRSMLDMVMPAVLRHLPLPGPGEEAADSLWRLQSVEGQAIAETDQVPAAADAAMERLLNTPVTPRLFQPEATAPVPLKTSVSTLTRQRPLLSEEDTEETVEEKSRTEDAVRTIRLSETISRPAFLEEEKVEAAYVGSVTHRFLRLVRLEKLREPGADVSRILREEVARMRAEDILTEEEAGLIRMRGAISFFRDPLGQRMLHGASLKREAEFTLRIPGSPTLVQGIVDCAFQENGQWILIDYKTDHNTDEAVFVPRHSVQMNWYRTAMERITGLPVKEMWLFALRSGQAFAVPRQDVLPGKAGNAGH